MQPQVFKTTRGNRIFRPRVGNYFSPQYTLRKTKAGQSQYFQLGTNLKRAKTLADKIWVFLQQPGHGIKDAVEIFNPVKAVMKERGKTPTVGELITIYQRTSDHKQSTKEACSRALRTISASILGITRLHVKGRTADVIEKWREKADSLKIDEITASKIAEFRNQLLGEAGEDGIKLGKARTTFNAYRRNAGQLLSKRAKEGYGDTLKLPEKNPFQQISAAKEPNHGFKKKVDSSWLIEEAESELKDHDPDAYVVFILALFGGLSRSEMDRLLWDQLDLAKGRVQIKPTRYYEPKTANRIGEVPLSSFAIDVLKRYKAHQIALVSERFGFDSNAEFVLPGALPSEKMPRIRANPTFKRLTKWLRTKGMTYQKPIHSLRKMASSNIFEQTGSMELAANFGRHLPEVARGHYVAKGELIPVNFR